MSRDKIIQFNKDARTKHSFSKGYTLYNEGMCFYNQDKDDLALQKFLEAQKLGFKSADLYAYISVLISKDEKAKSLEYISKAIELDDQNGFYHLFRGQILLEWGRSQEAFPSILKAEELGTDNLYLYTGASYCYEVRGDILKAMSYAAKALKKYPDESGGYKRKAWLYYTYLNKKDEALKYFLEAEKRGDKSNYSEISNCYYELENAKLALAYANKYILLDVSNPWGYYQKGFAYFYLENKYEEALENFLKADSLAQNDRESFNNMYPCIASIYAFVKRDFENAKKYAQVAIDMDPKSGDSYYIMGYYYSYYEKDFKKAEKCFLKTYKLGVENLFFNVYFELGRTYFMMGKYSLAMKYAEEGQKLYPDNNDFIQIKANVLYKQGKKEQTLELLEKILKNYPDDIWCKQLYALILFDFKRYDEAIERFEAIRGNLSNINIHSLYALASCYFEKTYYEKSIDTLLEYSEKEDLIFLEEEDIKCIKSLIKKLSKIYLNDDRLHQIKENFKSLFTL